MDNIVSWLLVATYVVLFGIYLWQRWAIKTLYETIEIQKNTITILRKK